MGVGTMDGVGTTTLGEDEGLNAHNYLEDLRKRNELNDRIMTTVGWIVDRVSQQCDEIEVRGAIETLTKLLHMRKSRESTLGGQRRAQ